MLLISWAVQGLSKLETIVITSRQLQKCYYFVPVATGSQLIHQIGGIFLEILMLVANHDNIVSQRFHGNPRNTCMYPQTFKMLC